MSTSCGPRIALVVSLVLGILTATAPPPAQAVYVILDGSGNATQFKVAGQLVTITPTRPNTTFADPTCGSNGGTSLAQVQGSKLAGVDPVAYPVVLVVSCLDSGGATPSELARRLNFLNPADGKVVKQILATTAPSKGFPHIVHRADKGDLLACGVDGTIYSIDYSQFTSTPDGTVTPLLSPGFTSCIGFTWDAEEEMVYQAVSGGSNTAIHRFKDGTTTELPTFNTPCTPTGLTISGGVLLVACNGTTILRLDKATGALLDVHGTLTATGLPALNPDPGLGDLACDPVTFHKDLSGKDQFTDALWSRRGSNGNGVVALEFPAFTCGLPSNSVVVDTNGKRFSPLAPGLAIPGTNGPGELPRTQCFDTAGKVKDADDDGIPDCFELKTLWAADPDAVQRPGIDFDGDGVRDFKLCVMVDTNGDGVADTEECAVPDHRDLFVEVDWMLNRKPDPRALSQASLSGGVSSVREAFKAAPVDPLNTTPQTYKGIALHIQLDEQVTFPNLLNLATPPQAPLSKSFVSELVFTPCTPPAINPATGLPNVLNLADAADFDDIKKANFGTVCDRVGGGTCPPGPFGTKTLNAKRLVFRYALYANNQAGTGGGGSSNSGCSELGGDDMAVTLGVFIPSDLPGVSPGLTGQQAGTFMHEFGHLLRLRHGGGDNDNCKSNYLSVMSYSRQFPDSPITGRRLDYSRAELPFLADLNKTGKLDETQLNEFDGLGFHPSLGTITGPNNVTLFSPDQTAYGPDNMTVFAASGVACAASNNSVSSANCINWNRSTFTKGSSKGLPSYGPSVDDPAPISKNINQASDTSGCDGAGSTLKGHDDWSHILYRASAALEYVGGKHLTVGAVPSGVPASPEHVSITTQNVNALWLSGDYDGNGIGDAQDCGTFLCEHRIDVKPSFPLPKVVDPGTEANVSVAIFSESSGSLTWSGPGQVLLDAAHLPTLTVGTVVSKAKVNAKGEGTCSTKDVQDPVTLIKDGLKDIVCQFSTSGWLPGKYEAIVSGQFCADPACSDIRDFRGKQLITVVE